MTFGVVASRASFARFGRGKRSGRVARPVPRGAAVPPLSPQLHLARAVMIVIVVVCASLLAHLSVFSSLQQRSAQDRAYDAFRVELANGTAPIGPMNADNQLHAPGTPIALIEIRAIGLEQVVGEGTNASTLFDGPGHRRDSPLPGQIGTSVIFGRSGAYGAPFGGIGDLVVDDKISVTTGQGAFEFRVLGVRREGDAVPAPPAPGTARLLLVTADGPNLFPTGVLRVDAEMIGEAVVGPPQAISTDALPTEERAMESQTDTLWALAMWMQCLTVLTVGAIWGWMRWGRPQAWIVFTPALALVGLSAASELTKLMPNLL